MAGVIVCLLQGHLLAVWLACISLIQNEQIIVVVSVICKFCNGGTLPSLSGHSTIEEKDSLMQISTNEDCFLK